METSESAPCDVPYAVDQVSCGLDSGLRADHFCYYLFPEPSYVNIGSLEFVWDCLKKLFFSVFVFKWSFNKLQHWIFSVCLLSVKHILENISLITWHFIIFSFYVIQAIILKA